MKNYLQGMELKDRRALLALGLFLAVVVLYLGVLRPSWLYYAEGKTSLQENLELVQWIDTNSDRASQEGNASGNPNQNLLQTLTQTAASRGLTISRYQPQQDSKVRLWLNETSYVEAIKWLDELQTNYQVEIDAITIDKTQRPGLVNIQCTLG